jgi:hypothetical protein
MRTARLIAAGSGHERQAALAGTGAPSSHAGTVHNDTDNKTIRKGKQHGNYLPLKGDYPNRVDSIQEIRGI